MEYYIQILIETLEKKKLVLDELIRLNLEQSEIIEQPVFDENAFQENTQKKEIQLELLEKLDNGFDANFQHCKDELIGHKEKYANQIKRMQELIREIIDKGSVIYADEHRNKNQIERQFHNKRVQIKEGRSNSKAAYDYYKVMNKSTYVDSMFMDHRQ